MLVAKGLRVFGRVEARARRVPARAHGRWRGGRLRWRVHADCGVEGGVGGWRWRSRWRRRGWWRGWRRGWRRRRGRLSQTTFALPGVCWKGEGLAAGAWQGRVGTVRTWWTGGADGNARVMERGAAIEILWARSSTVGKVGVRGRCARRKAARVGHCLARVDERIAKEEWCVDWQCWLTSEDDITAIGRRKDGRPGRQGDLAVGVARARRFRKLTTTSKHRNVVAGPLAHPALAQGSRVRAVAKVFGSIEGLERHALGVQAGSLRRGWWGWIGRGKRRRRRRRRRWGRLRRIRTERGWRWCRAIRRWRRGERRWAWRRRWRRRRTKWR